MFRRKPLLPDKKDNHPKTLGEARTLIEKTFCGQGKYGWDARDRSMYFSMIGVAGMDNESDIRAIIADLEKSKLVLFKEEK